MGFKQQNEQLLQNEPLNFRINLSYPISTFYGRSFSLQVILNHTSARGNF